MSGVSWYRVVTHADGSISTCERVEDRRQDTRRVHYVRADSLEEATQKILQQIAERQAKSAEYNKKHAESKKEEQETRRDECKAVGLCVYCTKYTAEEGKVACIRCAKTNTLRLRGHIRPTVKTDYIKLGREYAGVLRTGKPETLKAAVATYQIAIDLLDTKSMAECREYLSDLVNKVGKDL